MARSTRLILICQAATAATRAAAFPRDEPAETGSLAKAAALALGPVDRAWTSPAGAARQTAAALGLTAAPEALLRDADWGLWAGRSVADLADAEPAALQAWLADPLAAPHGGESVAGLIARVGAWLDGVRAEPGRVAAVTHAAVIRAAIVYAIGAGPAAWHGIDVPPLGRAVLQADGGRWRLRSLGDARR